MGKGYSFLAWTSCGILVGAYISIDRIFENGISIKRVCDDAKKAWKDLGCEYKVWAALEIIIGIILLLGFHFCKLFRELFYDNYFVLGLIIGEAMMMGVLCYFKKRSMSAKKKMKESR